MKAKKNKEEEKEIKTKLKNNLETNLSYLEQLKLFCLHYHNKIKEFQKLSLKKENNSLTLYENCLQTIATLEENTKENFAKLNSNKTKRLRILADFENYKKHLQKEANVSYQFANQNLIMNLLPILDNFHRALAYKHPSAEVKNFLTGFKMVIDHFENVLKKQGVQEIITNVNDNFDHDLHEGIEVVATDKYQPNKVIKIIQKGYLLNKRVIRPVKVVLAKKIETKKQTKEINKNG